MAEGEPLDPVLPEDAAPGQATDMSQQGNLRKAWGAWTSRPENNAALLNFGLSLMQPVQAGQSKLGHWAESIGAGAEASGRNIAEQRKQAAEDVEQEQKQQALDIKEREAGAYEKYMGSRMEGKATPRTQALLYAQKRLQNWKDTPEDPLGDTTTNVIRGMNPKWAKYKKADILRDPEARAAATNHFLRDAMEEAKTFGGSGEPTAAGSEPPVPRAVLRRGPDGRTAWFDPVTRQPIGG